MKTHKTFKTLSLVCLVFIFLISLSYSRILRPMDFQFNPGLDGSEAVFNAYPNGNDADKGEILQVKVYPLADQNTTLFDAEFHASDTIHVVIPHRNKEELICVRVYQKTKDIPKFLAEWRVWHTQGKSLWDYKGNPATKRPADFDAYWDKAKADLAKVALNPVIEPCPDKNSATGNCYKILLPSVGNMTIVAWYTVPKDADRFANPSATKQYPAVQWTPGYGGGQGPFDWTNEGYITLGVNPRGHGASSTYFALPKQHHLWNIDKPEEYYYRQAYLDCLRGIDFLASRPEVDPKHIGVEGSSQGGAFTLAVAGLDSRVSCAVARVPYLSNIPDYTNWAIFARGFGDEMAKPHSGETVKRVLNYIDAANMAQSVKCPILITIGLQDRTCPPLCGIVDFNRIPQGVTKKLVPDPLADHENSPLMWDEAKRWKDYFLKPSENK
jgi:cephalosporin-C deacetylase-like acetyl esterase